MKDTSLVNSNLKKRKKRDTKQPVLIKDRDYDLDIINYIKKNAGIISINDMCKEINLTRNEIEFICLEHNLPKKLNKNNIKYCQEIMPDEEVLKEKARKNALIAELIKEEEPIFETEIDKVLWEIEQNNKKPFNFNK